MKLALALVVAFPLSAAAHANLTSPTPRNDLANKTGPCGVARGTSPHLFMVGSQLQVTFIETIEHPGYYTLSFSAAADQNFTVLRDNIPDLPGATTQMPNQYSVTVTLPSQPCTDCTLQLIQHMTDSNSNYYSCADLELVTTDTDLSVLADAGAVDLAGPHDLATTGTTGPSADGSTTPMASSWGCAIGGGGSGCWLVFLLAWLYIRRRHGRHVSPRAA